MKYLCLFLVLVCPNRAWADDLFALRPLDAWASESLERGRRRSALVRSLIDQIERSDLIVHIETQEWMAPDLAGTTRLVTSVGTHRYVRISLRRCLSPNMRAAILGHELQHTSELAASRAVNDASVGELFARVGVWHLNIENDAVLATIAITDRKSMLGCQTPTARASN